MSKINFILGGDSITVFHNGNSYTINKQAHTYDMVLKAVRAGDSAALQNALEIRVGIAAALKATGGTRVVVNADDNTITYDGRSVDGLIASRIFEMLRLDLDTAPMVRFLENLMANPSKRAVDEMFGFLEACKLPITEDGHFLAYKRVRGDYKDCHSGSMDNSVGEKLSMPRNLVDEDKNRTCSAGLHFCSYDYLAHFGGERIVVLKINPADVVAIPVDYNNSKGRTCAYEVVDEIPLNEFKLPIKEIDEGYTQRYSAWSDLELDYDYDDEDEDEDEDYEESYEESYEEEEEEEELEESLGYTVRVIVPVALPAAASGVKLTPADVRQVRRLLNRGEDTLADIGRKFGVHPRTIARIRDGEAWNDV